MDREQARTEMTMEKGLHVKYVIPLCGTIYWETLFWISIVLKLLHLPLKIVQDDLANDAAMALISYHLSTISKQ